MVGQVVRWVGLPRLIYDSEVILLNFENPSLNSRWGLAMSIVEYSHQRLVVSDCFKLVAIELEVKMLYAPCYH